MIVPVNPKNVKVGDYVLVMSKFYKFLAAGLVKAIGPATGKTFTVEITSFNTQGMDIRSCIGSDVPDNHWYKIGGEYQFTEKEVFKIVDDDK